MDGHKSWKLEMDEKAFVAKSNALALAGALTDGEMSDVPKQPVPDSTDNKVGEHYLFQS